MNAPELLTKLRAAGVEALPDDQLMTIAAMLAKGVFPNLTKETALRFAADLLAARAKLAELRAWANQEADPCAHDPEQDIARRRCADAVLAILDREAP